MTTNAQAEHADFDVSRFEWDPSTMCFTVEASKLQALPHDDLVMGMFHPLDADGTIGFTMVGRSGVVVSFAVVDSDSRDGDVSYWTLRPTALSLAQVSSCDGVAIVIFNN